MPNVMADRRDAPRYSLVLVAEIMEIGTGTKTSAQTSDISRIGCYVDTLNPAPIGARIRLRLLRGEDSFETEARVVYTSPKLGMGLRFLEQVGDGQLALLDGWLDEAAINP
ncbi:MAG: PilZ domain-containing protein [Candidatus Acidiferrum sp.]